MPAAEVCPTSASRISTLAKNNLYGLRDVPPTVGFPGEKTARLAEHLRNFDLLHFGGVSMKSSLVTRDQFDISPQGVVHKPTGAAFTPHPGDCYSGTTRMAALGSPQPNGVIYRADDVERIMRELWAEYITTRQLRKLKR